ncbi:MAG: ATP-binding cassette domain-containing protein [Methanomassiliicoccales archaeon]|nr:MAG: ATP-binding cassette domain-containing protein [Methanomassiliicoccales archaeon]
MDDVSYSYPDGTLALQNLGWRVERGQKVAVLGPNGAGKSTLLKILAGLIFPKRGSVTVDGVKLKKKNADIIRRKFGFLFQDPDDQIFMPRVWDDIAFGPINLGLSENEVESAVRDAIQKAGLVGFEERVPHHMSYGEKKRVAIAGVLAMRPEILLLDEPTSNLDPRGRTELIAILRNLENTMIIATHDVNVASLIAERALVLNKKKLAEGSLREVFSQSSLLEGANLEVPDIAKLFLLLQEEGLSFEELPLSVREGSENLKHLFERKKR